MKKFLFIFLSIFLASKAYTLEFKFMGGGNSFEIHWMAGTMPY